MRGKEPEMVMSGVEERAEDGVDVFFLLISVEVSGDVWQDRHL